MLTRHELVRLDRSLRTTKVLSVYLDGGAASPAERTTWRRELERAIARERDRLRAAPHEEVEAFDLCVGRLYETLAEHQGALPAAGWAGFFAADGQRHFEALPLPMPNLIHWGDGMRVAPYIRVLKQHLPAIAAVVDSRIARVYLYARGTIEKVETLRSHAHGEPKDRMGTQPSVGFHPGTRGVSATDEATRVRRAGTEALIREVVDLLDTLAGRHSWVLIGGIPEVAARVLRMLPDSLQPRAATIPLDVHATAPEIKATTERVVREVSRERDRVQVAQVLDRQRAGGRGACGYAATCDALLGHAAERVYFTNDFIRDRGPEAEMLVRLAFSQAAEITHVSGDAAALLDASDGVGALLRFVPPMPQLPAAPAAADTPREAVAG